MARLKSLQGFGLLMDGRIDSARVIFQSALDLSRLGRTPSEVPVWGLGLARRLAAPGAAFDSMPAAPTTLPESFFSRGWMREAAGDTSGALADYAAALFRDSTWTPPYLRRARLFAGRGEMRAAEALLDLAAALGDTLAAGWKARLIPPPPVSPEDSLVAAAEHSPGLTRLEWAALLRKTGQVHRASRWMEPELEHFHPARDSLRDLEGSPWVGLAHEAVVESRVPLFPDASFHGEDPVTRAQFAMWLDEFQPASEISDPPPPADLFPSDYRSGAISRVLARGLMTCPVPSRFDPDAAVTGAEALQALRGLTEGR